MSLTFRKLNNNLIAISVGDINGIGIHLLIKEFLNNKINNFVLITNIRVFRENIKFPISKINLINERQFNKYKNSKLNIYSFKTKNKHTNTLDSLNFAYKLTKKKQFIGILTLPLNKNKINKYVNKDFIDQTSFFSKKENEKSSNMIFYYKKKFFIPLTIHIELKKVYKCFKNKEHILNKIESLFWTLKKDFKIKKPKMILAGINPHAGEKGTISKDESKYLKPIVDVLKKKRINITGPESGDGMVNKQNIKKFDAFIFTYHDQALIPFKIISNYEGVNFTSKLNVIRVSPSHGTCEHLIGLNIATSKGIINSFNLIKKIYKNRN